MEGALDDNIGINFGLPHATDGRWKSLLNLIFRAEGRDKGVQLLK